MPDSNRGGRRKKSEDENKQPVDEAKVGDVDGNIETTAAQDDEGEVETIEELEEVAEVEKQHKQSNSQRKKSHQK